MKFGGLLYEYTYSSIAPNCSAKGRNGGELEYRVRLVKELLVFKIFHVERVVVKYFETFTNKI